MSQSIHGHQVIDLVSNSEILFTTSTLKIAVAEQFGDDSLFHTCMDSNLTAEDLINFLVSKGKFIETEAGFIAVTGSC
ncbi:YecH family metal-binding protein [Psychromonas sp. MME1]|uniref:YecH family metal-binding protein n=1 Tax=Psychromonas sp. MME1 TaxID=3231032 RepID=UPI0034E252AC